jgi:hypothetical protein
MVGTEALYGGRLRLHSASLTRQVRSAVGTRARPSITHVQFG